MTEADLDRAVVGECLDRGLWTLHLPAHVSRLLPAAWRGWPDRVIIGRGGMLWRELKGPRGVVSPEQRRAGRALLAAGQDWAVWTPRDWPTRIRAELSALT